MRIGFVTGIAYCVLLQGCIDYDVPGGGPPHGVHHPHPHPVVSATPGPVYPFATPVPDKPGYVISPYAESEPYINVKLFPRGTQIKCPYTGKIFLVP